MGSSIGRSWNSELEKPEFQPDSTLMPQMVGFGGKSCKSSNFPFRICKIDNGISLSRTLLGGSNEVTRVKCSEGARLTVNAQ